MRIEYQTVTAEAENVHPHKKAETRIEYQTIAAEAEDLHPRTQMKGVLHIQPREPLPSDASQWPKPIRNVNNLCPATL